MKIYSYRLNHDYGLAPNPFGEYCTLVVCKPKIRKSSNLEIGDWILGTGSLSMEKETKKLNLHKSIIYAMKVNEIISMENYWSDPRFQYKKPNMNGSLVMRFGDNFYYKDHNMNWKQEESAHTNKEKEITIKHIKRDISGKNAIISTKFYYFGNNAPIIPPIFNEFISKGRSIKTIKDEKLCSDFLNWLDKYYKLGINGDPVNWTKFNQPMLF